MRLLFVSPVYPLPAVTGTRIRLAQLIRALGERGHEVGLVARISPDERHLVPELAPHLSDQVLVPVRGRDERHAPLRHGLAAGLARLGLMLPLAARGAPRLSVLSAHPLMAEAVRTLAPAYDLVFVEFFFMAANIPGDLLRAYPRHFVLVEHDISYVPLRRAAALRAGLSRLKAELAWRITRREELRQLRRLGRAAAMSETDRALLLSLVPELDVRLAPNGVDTETHAFRPRSPAGGDVRLLFVGSLGFGPNLDAVRHFIESHLPALRRTHPGTRLTVVGAPAQSRDVFAGLDLAAVEFTGFVPDIAPYYAACTAFVAPFRIGGGTRLKVMEAMASGLPVIGSRIGLEGIDVRDREHVLFADDPDETAAALTWLLEDPAGAQTMAYNARRLCETRYDWRIIAAMLEEFIHDPA